LRVGVRLSLRGANARIVLFAHRSFADLRATICCNSVLCLLGNSATVGVSAVRARGREATWTAPISTPSDEPPALSSARREGTWGLAFSLMNWIRIAVGIGDDPEIHKLASRLAVTPHEAIGLVVLLLTKFPEHAETGDLSEIPDSLLERWAGWSGERGAFAQGCRETFLNDAGVWEAWEKHNGAALREYKATRERAAEYRRRRAAELLTTGDATPDSTAYGKADGTPNRKVLRTDGRTNLTTVGRSRALNGNGTTYAPGHSPANLDPPPFCASCGEGELVAVPGQKRPVRRHAAGCTQC